MPVDHDGFFTRRLGVETKQAFFRSAMVARAAGEEMVSQGRLLASFFRTRSVGDYCQTLNVAPLDVASMLEEPAAIAFDECMRRIEHDLQEKGIAFGSREHIAIEHPLPLDPAARPAIDALVFGEGEGAVTPLEVLLEMMRADPALAARLASHGLTTDGIQGAL